VQLDKKEKSLFSVLIRCLSRNTLWVQLDKKLQAFREQIVFLSRNTLWVQLDKKYDPVVMIGQDLPESQYSMSAIR